MKRDFTRYKRLTQNTGKSPKVSLERCLNINCRLNYARSNKHNNLQKQLWAFEESKLKHKTNHMKMTVQEGCNSKDYL